MSTTVLAKHVKDKVCACAWRFLLLLHRAQIRNGGVLFRIATETPLQPLNGTVHADADDGRCGADDDDDANDAGPPVFMFSRHVFNALAAAAADDAEDNDVPLENRCEPRAFLNAGLLVFAVVAPGATLRQTLAAYRRFTGAETFQVGVFLHGHALGGSEVLAELPATYRYYHEQCTLALRNVWLACLAHTAAAPRVRYTHPYDGPDLRILVGPDATPMAMDLDALTRDDNRILMAWLFARLERADAADATGGIGIRRPRWILRLPDETVDTVRIACDLVLQKRDPAAPVGPAVQRLKSAWGLI